MQLFFLELDPLFIDLQVRFELIRPRLHILQLFYCYHKPIFFLINLDDLALDAARHFGAAKGTDIRGL